MEAADGGRCGNQGLLYLELQGSRTGPHLCTEALRGQMVLHHGMIILDSTGDQHPIPASAHPTSPCPSPHNRNTLFVNPSCIQVS